MPHIWHRLLGGKLEVRYADRYNGYHAPEMVALESLPDPTLRIEQLLSTNGDGTGVTNMAAAAAVYKVVPPVTEVYVLTRINVYMEDNGKFRADQYGAAQALADGIVMSVEDANGTVSLLTPKPITKFGHWNLGAGIDTLYTDFPAGNTMAAVRWTYRRGGGLLVLDGSLGRFLQVNVQDNLGAGGAALVEHYAQVQGKRIVISN